MRKKIKYTRIEEVIPADDVRDFVMWLIEEFDKAKKEPGDYLKITASRKFWNDITQKITDLFEEDK